MVAHRVTWVRQQEKIKKSDLVIQLSAESEFTNLEEQKTTIMKRKPGRPSTKSKSNVSNKRPKSIKPPKKKYQLVKMPIKKCESQQLILPLNAKCH